jgi:ABC-type dipeptide/oligopeptide/nickel transport system permease component
MFQFLFWRALRILAILLAATLIPFLLMHAIPGNPWSSYSTQQRMLPNFSSDKALEREITHRFGLDLPLWRQYTRYIIGDFDQNGGFFCGAVCGNLGPSIQQHGRAVQDILFKPPKGMSFWRSQFGYSIRLVLCGLVIAVVFGISLGTLSARKPRSNLSRAISFGLAALMSIPNFVLGLLAIIVFASWLKVIKVLPDWNNWAHWIIPAIVLAVVPMSSMARVTHVSLVNILKEDYVRTAHAKGLTERRVFIVHAFRTALIPILAFLGSMVMELFAGLFIVENLYAFPGFGRQYWVSVLQLDYPVVIGLTLVLAAVLAVTNLAIDTISAILDPRVRSSSLGGKQW